jgi:hypothetical protein
MIASVHLGLIAFAEDETESGFVAKQIDLQMTQGVQTQLQKLNLEYKAYGKFTCEGMTAADYKNMQSLNWKKVTLKGETVNQVLDLKKLYKYKDLENFMFNLARNTGVELYTIGKTKQKRNIYSIKIDYFPNENKKIILYTGGVHAREGAGPVYILKQFSELITKAKTDPKVLKILSQVTFIAIPSVNPDGREMIINGGSASRKSNANGVDINRNFPALNASQLVKGIKMYPYYSKKPSMYYFCGYSLGSEKETQAAMKWLDTYIPKASIYIDYHQQGHQVYGGKPYDTLVQESEYKKFANSLLSVINKGISSGKYVYKPEVKNYGLNGTGGTITDYAVSVAAGMKFSQKFGRMILYAGKEELPLLKMKDLDKFKKYLHTVNSKIHICTYEICSGSSTLGFSTKARFYIDKEYAKYHFDLLPIYNAKQVLGIS